MRMSKFLRNGKKAAGFSLIELLVVVGIIGVLAAVGVPKYSKYQSRSRDAAGVTYMTTINTNIEGNKAVSGAAYLDADVAANRTVLETGLVLPAFFTWDAAATVGGLGTYRIEIDAAANALGSCQATAYNIFATNAVGVTSGIAAQCS